MSVTVEMISMWLTVTAYAAGAALFIVGFVFAKANVTRWAVTASAIGLVPHAVATGVRWARVGHGPYIGFYEVVSILALATVATVVVIAWRNVRLEPLGVILMPISFLMLGGAMLAPKTDFPITATLASWWLVIHIGFAMASYAAFMASFALAIVYLVRERKGYRPRGLLAKMPSQLVVDDLTYRFVFAGSIFLGVMIVAGAIWANEAWGRYWGWDPIETWSLISWLVYAAYLHLRLTMGWRGKKSAWVAILALPIVVFALIGVPVFYHSIHGAYLTGTGG